MPLNILPTKVFLIILGEFFFVHTLRKVFDKVSLSEALSFIPVMLLIIFFSFMRKKKSFYTKTYFSDMLKLKS